MLKKPIALDKSVFRICMVCTGNICRSPMAEIVLRDLVHQSGLEQHISVSSAGTGEWHVGERADPRAVKTLEQHGYNGSAHRARQFEPSWFESTDLVIALDRSHERVLKSWATNETDQSKVLLLTSFAEETALNPDVPDPYYSDETFFDSVLLTIEKSCRGLFQQIEPGVRLYATKISGKPTDQPRASLEERE